jgi:hypothetical protein
MSLFTAETWSAKSRRINRARRAAHRHPSALSARGWAWSLGTAGACYAAAAPLYVTLIISAVAYVAGS